MSTAQQYFAELKTCLGHLPQAERQALLDYQQEYAAEAGLDSYQALAQHFGTPQQLADRLCSELDARRSAGSDVGDAAGALGDAIKRLLDSVFGNLNAEPAPDGADGSWVTQPLPDFCGVDIQVVAADVRFEAGDGYAVRYRLPEGEVLDRLEVTDGTLHLITRGGRRHGGRVTIHMDGGTFRLGSFASGVVVVLPGEAELARTELNSVSGDLLLTDRTCQDLRAGTVSGDVAMQQVDCTTAQIRTVSGDVELTTLGCDRISVQTTSGDVKLEDLAANSGSIRTVSGDVNCQAEMDMLTVVTTSGDCRIAGDVKEAVECTSVSGDLEVLARDASVCAQSRTGSIRCDGARAGRSLTLEGTGCCLTLKTTSGDIAVSTR